MRIGDWSADVLSSELGAPNWVVRWVGLGLSGGLLMALAPDVVANAQASPVAWKGEIERSERIDSRGLLGWAYCAVLSLDVAPVRGEILWERLKPRSRDPSLRDQRRPPSSPPPIFIRSPMPNCPSPSWSSTAPSRPPPGPPCWRMSCCSWPRMPLRASGFAPAAWPPLPWNLRLPRSATPLKSDKPPVGKEWDRTG